MCIVNNIADYARRDRIVGSDWLVLFDPFRGMGEEPGGLEETSLFTKTQQWGHDQRSKLEELKMERSMGSDNLYHVTRTQKNFIQ